MPTKIDELKVTLEKEYSLEELAKLSTLIETIAKRKREKEKNQALQAFINAYLDFRQNYPNETYPVYTEEVDDYGCPFSIDAFNAIDQMIYELRKNGKVN